MLKTTGKEFAALVRNWQETYGLEMDGVLGPLTRASVHRYLGENISEGGILMNRVIALALADKGRGEQGGNNAGPYVRALRKLCGFPVDLLGAWCAIFVSAKILRAVMSLGLVLPCELSRGAYRLVMNIGESDGGEFITVPEPGFACWKRKRWLRKREAHIRIITGYDIATDTMHYVAGNEGGKVVIDSLPQGRWRKDLVVMAAFR